MTLDPRPLGRVRTRIAWRSPWLWVGVVTWGSLIAFALIGIGLPLLGIGTFLDTGILGEFAPWNSVLKQVEPAHNVYPGDTVDSVFPQASLLVSLAREGVFAQWNPYAAGGVELGGLPNSGLYSPLSWPWWVVPLQYAPGLVKLMEIIAVTIGMSLYLRRLGVRSQVWPIASLIFSASGFMIAWTNWPQTRVAAFIPLVFWALDRAAVEHRLRDILAVGFTFMGMLLGGFPAVALFTLTVGAFYVVVRAILANPRWRSVFAALGVAAGGVVFGLIVSAWQIFPFAMNAMSVINFGARAESGDTGKLGWVPLLTAYLPDAMGYHATGNNWGPGPNPVEAFSYVGIAAVVLAAIVLFLRSRNTPRGIVLLLACLAAGSIVIVYGGGVPLSLLHHLPLFNTNPIGRWRSVIGFLLAALAGLGLNVLLDGSTIKTHWAELRTLSAPRAALRAVGAVISIAAALLMAYATFKDLQFIPARFHRYVLLEAVATAAIGLVLIFISVLVKVSGRTWTRVLAAVAASAFVAIPAMQVVQHWWTPGTSANFYSTTPAIAYLQKHVGQQRIATVGNAMKVGTTTVYQLRTLNGHAFQTQEWSALERAIDADSFSSVTYSGLSPQNLTTSMTSPIMDRLGVSYVISDAGYPVPGAVEDPHPQTTTASLPVGGSARTDEFTGPVRGLEVSLPSGVAAVDGVTLKVDVVSATTGKTMTSTSTWFAAAAPGVRNVALQGDDIPESQRWYAIVTIDGVPSPTPIGETADGRLAVKPVVPAPGDGITVVHTGDATIFHRATALERVRWAGSAVELQTGDVTVSALAKGNVANDAIAVPPGTPGAGSSASTGRVTIDPSDVDHIKATVETTGSGWVVVADSLQRPGWTATVDGKPADIVQADNAAGAVRVAGGGTHAVVLSYQTPGLVPGVVVSVSTLLGTAALVVIWVLRRRRRRLAH